MAVLSVGCSLYGMESGQGLFMERQQEGRGCCVVTVRKVIEGYFAGSFSVSRNGELESTSSGSKVEFDSRHLRRPKGCQAGGWSSMQKTQLCC